MDTCVRFGVFRCRSYNRFVYKNARKRDIKHLSTVLHDGELLVNGQFTTVKWDYRQESEMVSCIEYIVRFRPKEIDLISYDNLDVFSKTVLCKILVILMKRLKLTGGNNGFYTPKNVLLYLRYSKGMGPLPRYSYTKYCTYNKETIINAILDVISRYK